MSNNPEPPKWVRKWLENPPPKTCSKCSQTKPRDEFYNTNVCKVCTRTYNRKSYYAQQEARLEYMQVYRDTHREERRVRQGTLRCS